MIHSVLLVIGVLLALIWWQAVLETAVGMKRTPLLTSPEWDKLPRPGPRVSILVPARNEERRLEEALTSLLKLDYSNYQIIAVNDRSVDATGAIMDRAAASSPDRMKVVHVTELPPSWLGKPHALAQAAKLANGEWLLLTDADVVFRPDALRRSMAYVQTSQPDHVFTLPNMEMKTAGEAMVKSYIMSMSIFIRPWRANDPRSMVYGGVGAFNLVRRSALQKIGGFEALRMEVVEDLKLGKLIKRAGLKQHMVRAPDMLSIHWASGIRGVVNNMTKNGFAILGYRVWLACLAALALAGVSLGPLIGTVLAPGSARIGFALALFAIFSSYAGLRLWMRIPLYNFFFYPASALIAVYIIFRSAWFAVRDGGITWRGTLYPLEELRKGLV